ncbi:MAG: glycogen synthase GlgA [Candidatus Contendobacter odensis]|uniref:Glycogen synthase n=1 Tax=Candidatus Contendibacter odensensis TaxID=1400860 RepID=A0A2G6PEC4_9GAMM|nr:MAG: glycogen synthase GlgA [Candidatus Contendobacter odensis]
MYIVQIASECAPVAKVGGLADVIFGLSRELEIRGNEVHLVLPKYDCMRYDQIWGLQITMPDLWVPWYDGAIHCSVWFGFAHGRKCFLIEPHSQDNFFNRGHFYGFSDDISRFAFFSKAALEFLLQDNRRPDIIHCHDWQTGLVPVLLFEQYARGGLDRQRICYTIHNFKHQGLTGDSPLRATGLTDIAHYFNTDRLRDDLNHTAVNLMKGGVVYSNFVTTVSPTHAHEARYTDQGGGLGHTLNVHGSKFGGVLNGIDYEVWNPEIDPHIPAHYGIETLDDKYKNKEALCDRLWLSKEYKPVIAYVGRLDSQKGVDLIHHALFYALRQHAQFVLLGSSPDPHINHHFWNLKRHLNDSADCHLELGFDEELSHLIYAGADMIVMPSLFEPCGLTQMISLKYGTVPIVRAVGGLKDTVFDKDYSEKPWEERNGFVFHQPDHAGIESAMYRAIRLWFDFPNDFRQLMMHGMSCDYSWCRPGQDYMNIYEHIRCK